MAAECLVTEEIAIQKSSVFFVHGYAHHGRSGWRENYSFQDQSYLIPENHDLPDAAAFLYRDSIHAESRADALPVRKVCRSQEVDVDVDGSEEESSENNNEKNSEPSDFMLERAKNPE